MGFSGSMFGGGGLAGGGATTDTLWKELAVADVTKVDGSYGFTHGAGQNGFTHRITIDTAADSIYFNTGMCSYLYIDTGISMTTLSAKRAMLVSVLMEFDFPASGSSLEDANAEFHFGPFICNNTTIGSSTMGFHGGVVIGRLGGDYLFRCSGGIGLTGNDTTISLGSLARGVGDNTYDQSNGDIGKSVQLSATGISGAEAGDKFGLSGADLLFGHTKGSSGPFVHNSEEFVLRNFRLPALGNLIIGCMFGQNTDAAGGGTVGNSKTFDFDLKYMIDFVDAPT